MDKMAERTWLELGGEVLSFRVRQLAVHESAYDTFVIERWEIGGDEPKVFVPVEEPTFGNALSALNYRNILIAEACDRLVLFHKGGWRGGGGMTEEFARDTYEKPTYVYEAAA